MKYFDLVDDIARTRRWYIGEVLLPDAVEPDLISGIRMDDLRPLRADIHHIGTVVEYCHTSFGVPIATNALARTITAVVGADVQCLPITIEGQTEMVVLNALRVVRCIDEQHSEFLKWTTNDHRPELAGRYRSVPKIVLNRSSIPPNAHFFRIKDWEIALIVSEVVKDAMERAGCYGAKFIEVETT